LLVECGQTTALAPPVAASQASGVRPTQPLHVVALVWPALHTVHRAASGPVMPTDGLCKLAARPTVHTWRCTPAAVLQGHACSLGPGRQLLLMAVQLYGWQCVGLWPVAPPAVCKEAPPGWPSPGVHCVQWGSAHSRPTGAMHTSQGWWVLLLALTEAAAQLSMHRASAMCGVLGVRPMAWPLCMLCKLIWTPSAHAVLQQLKTHPSMYVVMGGAISGLCGVCPCDALPDPYFACICAPTATTNMYHEHLT
jgi:hypothetical protein